MIPGKVEIFLSLKEPDKNLLWLRPYLDKDGYELLYFGTNGWTPLGCNQCPFKAGLPSKYPEDANRNVPINEGVLAEIPDSPFKGVEGTVYEITPASLNLPETLKHPCGCSDITT